MSQPRADRRHVARDLLRRHVRRRAQDHRRPGSAARRRRSSRRARPKSMITSSRRRLIMMLAGFRSRWITPRRWASCRARASLRTTAAAWRCGSRPVGVDDLRQRLALDVGHRQVVDAVDLPDVVDRAEVGVVEGRRGAGLAVEPLEDLRAVLGGEVGDLQGHPAIELGVMGQVDRPHAPLPQPLHDPIAAELLGQFGPVPGRLGPRPRRRAWPLRRHARIDRPRVGHRPGWALIPRMGGGEGMATSLATPRAARKLTRRSCTIWSSWDTGLPRPAWRHLPDSVYR